MEFKNKELDFQPILLGSDFNVYGMARSFYDKYQIKSLAYASTQLAPTKYSKIVEVNVISGFNEDPVFINTMRELSKTLNDNIKYLLIACGDGYAKLVSKHKEELSKWFICPYVDFDMFEKLEDKVSFYNICEKYDLPYPKTKIIDKDMVENDEEIKLDFEFPVALKPANSVEWLDVQFEGRQKAFTLKTRAEFDTLLTKIYKAGYTDKMICQDFIPGDDSHMRVMNAYVDQNHKVQMMCLGHPLLEDPSPEAIGNYMVIMPDYNEEIYQRIKNFLEDINYTGFANFDMKYDPRDGEYKLFEINLRQGRSSFYCTLNGYNLAEYVTEDRIYSKERATVYGNGDMLWLGVPSKVFKEYAKDNEYKQKALEMLNNNKYGTTAFYDKDKSFKRNLLMKYSFYNFIKNFKQYFKQNKE